MWRRSRVVTPVLRKLAYFGAGRGVEDLACLAAGGRQVVVTAAGEDLALHAWDAITGQPLGAAFGPSSAYAIAAESLPGGQGVVVSGKTTTREVTGWEVTTGRELWRVSNRGYSNVWCTTLGGRPVAVAVHAHHDTTATILRVWDLATSTPLRDTTVQQSHSDATILACGQMGGQSVVVSDPYYERVRVTALDDGRQLGEVLRSRRLTSPRATVGMLGRRPVVVTNDSAGQASVLVWDLHRGSIVASLTPRTIVLALAWTTFNGRATVVTGGPGDVCVWDVARGARIACVETYTNTVACVPDGIVVGGGTRELAVIDFPGIGH